MHDVVTHFDLQDIWRVKHEKTQAFTWRQKKPLAQCRLDYFYASESIQECAVDSNIKPCPHTDHSVIIIKLNLSKVDDRRGKGFWKFNASL